MKVICTGVTGFIGGEVLHQCIKNSSITAIYTLSRRPLSEELANHAKVTSIILDDFMHYPDDILDQLAGAEACFWTIGVTNITFPADIRKIDTGYSQAAAKAFTELLQPQLPAGKKFRFVHVSGIFAETDQDKPLWFLDEGRHSKGESEAKLLEFARRQSDVFGAYVVHAGMVLGKGNALIPYLEWLFPSWCINVEHLALAMLSLAVEAGPSGVTENSNLIQKGRKLALSKSE